MMSLLVRSKSVDMSADTDKLVSVKGLVIRATPVIPDMSMGGSLNQKYPRPVRSS